MSPFLNSEGVLPLTREEHDSWARRDHDGSATHVGACDHVSHINKGGHLQVWGGCGTRRLAFTQATSSPRARRVFPPGRSCAGSSPRTLHALALSSIHMWGPFQQNMRRGARDLGRLIPLGSKLYLT